MQNYVIHTNSGRLDKVVVKALVHAPEWNIRVEAGYFDVSGRRAIECVVGLAAIYEDVMRERRDYVGRDDVPCN